MQDRLHARIDHYFERALALTRQRSLDRKAVHDLRVFCKKLRGLLRLYRSPSVPGLASLEAAVASIGKSLSANRDNEVLIQLITAWQLKRQKPLAAIQQALLSSLASDSAQLPPIRPATLRLALSKAQQQWLSLAPQIRQQPLKAALKRSIKKTQKNGHKALKKARAKRLHAWRKQVKYQYYQLDVLPPTPIRSKRYQQLKSLGTLLGDIHDLDLLARYLERFALNAKALNTEAFDTQALLKRVYQQFVQPQRVRLLQQVSPLFEKTVLNRDERQQLLQDLE